MFHLQGSRNSIHMVTPEAAEVEILVVVEQLGWDMGLEKEEMFLLDKKPLHWLHKHHRVSKCSFLYRYNHPFPKMFPKNSLQSNSLHHIQNHSLLLKLHDLCYLDQGSSHHHIYPVLTSNVMNFRVFIPLILQSRSSVTFPIVFSFITL